MLKVATPRQVGAHRTGGRPGRSCGASTTCRGGFAGRCVVAREGSALIAWASGQTQRHRFWWWGRTCRTAPPGCTARARERFSGGLAHPHNPRPRLQGARWRFWCQSHLCDRDTQGIALRTHYATSYVTQCANTDPQSSHNEYTETPPRPTPPDRPDQLAATPWTPTHPTPSRQQPE